MGTASCPASCPKLYVKLLSDSQLFFMGTASCPASCPKLYVKLLSDSQLFGSISNYRATFTATFSRSVTCASPRVHRVCTSILAWISGLLLHARGTQACLPSLVQGQVRAPQPCSLARPSPPLLAPPPFAFFSSSRSFASLCARTPLLVVRPLLASCTSSPQPMSTD
jgi:hypothetical protein